jgi:hypothetical protein
MAFEQWECFRFFPGHVWLYKGRANDGEAAAGGVQSKPGVSNAIQLSGEELSRSFINHPLHRLKEKNMATNNVTGQWVSVQPFPLGLAVILNLIQDSSGNITGSGTVQGPGSPVAACQVIPPSTNNFPGQPNVSVSLNIDGLGQATLAGNFTDGTGTQICGTVGSFGTGCVQLQPGSVKGLRNRPTAKKSASKAKKKR